MLTTIVHSGAFFDFRTLWWLLFTYHAHWYRVVRSLVLTPELESYRGEIGLSRRRPVEVGDLHEIRCVLIRAGLVFAPVGSPPTEASQKTRSEG